MIVLVGLRFDYLQNEDSLLAAMRGAQLRM